MLDTDNACEKYKELTNRLRKPQSRSPKQKCCENCNAETLTIRILGNKLLCIECREGIYNSYGVKG